MASVDLICGIDEAGRGPWAGPVCASAVILSQDHDIVGLADSKTLTARRREQLAEQIRSRAQAFALGWATVEEIDALNIRQATHLAMRRAVEALGVLPRLLRIDGNDLPARLPCPAQAVIGGDGLHKEISAASILAKTARDGLMVRADSEFPGYGFAAHKGYGTRAHAEALARLGPCPIHRRSFAPVARALSSAQGHATRA